MEGAAQRLDAAISNCVEATNGLRGSPCIQATAISTALKREKAAADRGFSMLDFPGGNWSG